MTISAESLAFRSVLPHEPLPHESDGWIQLQGNFEPKISKSKASKSQEEVICVKWTSEILSQALMVSSWIKEASGIMDIELMDKEAPFRQVRIRFGSPESAYVTFKRWKCEKLAPKDFMSSFHPSIIDPTESTRIHFSGKSLQITLITRVCMLSTQVAWTRPNPPKFRRLVQPSSEAVTLEEERSLVRFVFISGLIPKDKEVPEAWKDSNNVVEAIRRRFTEFDSSGMGVEVFVPNKSTAQRCHVGMRSPRDAQQVIEKLQGQSLQWKISNEDSLETIDSDKLFLDYADVALPNQDRSNIEQKIGPPYCSQCTSSTNSVRVPGLVLVEDFVSPDEETLILAGLLGPDAPWAPAQVTKSQSGKVRRRVQHYGYVFDYETSDVLRNRSEAKAACPPMPTMSLENEDLASSIETATKEGREWAVLGGVIERTRRHDFSETDAYREVSQKIVSYSRINQMTVNEYKKGEGIGSHVDTPHAFDDGLISISLGSGIVMEFNHTESDQCKLVYLPARSLLLMSGDARYKWEHYIVSRMTDTHSGKIIPRGLRVSLTLRTSLDMEGNILDLVESDNFPPRWNMPA